MADSRRQDNGRSDLIGGRYDILDEELSVDFGHDGYRRSDVRQDSGFRHQPYQNKPDWKNFNFQTKQMNETRRNLESQTITANTKLSLAQSALRQERDEIREDKIALIVKQTSMKEREARFDEKIANASREEKENARKAIRQLFIEQSNNFASVSREERKSLAENLKKFKQDIDNAGEFKLIPLKSETTPSWLKDQFKPEDVVFQLSPVAFLVFDVFASPSNQFRVVGVE